MIGARFGVALLGAAMLVATMAVPAVAQGTIDDLDSTNGGIRAPLASTPSIAVAVPDYKAAVWVPASASNYTVANRPDDYPVDMIVIHDIEGSYGGAITMFQNPSRHGSAHYIVSYRGQVTQMVAEKNIAWHAGNWDYNTRAIGIEHEGFAGSNTYTSAEYYASARIVASVCSRWGVPMDRRHVIGHSQVPDPNNPGLFGGDDNHWDPGPYWNWSGYMVLAQRYAAALPSPPHMMFKASAFSGDGTATVSWQPARTCHTPVDTYTVVIQPGNQTVTVPGSARTASFSGLTNGVNYSFTVTAQNSDGTDTTGSNVVTPGTSCSAANLSVSPAAPQSAGVGVRFTATSSGCVNPRYQFSVQDARGNWVVQQNFGGSGWVWDSYRFAAGAHNLRVWANHATADPSRPEAFAEVTYSLTSFSMAHWRATYDMSRVPTRWVAGRSQTFPVTVTNAGDVAWTSTGQGRVDLGLHFATSAGGSANQAHWLNSKAFQMAADLAPGASVTMNVTFAAPARTGSMVLEAQMVKEQDFWFQQWQPAAVQVADPARAAGYDLSNAPAAWVAGQSQTFQVTLTNTSTATWLSTGYYRTLLGLHFATSAGGAANRARWLNTGYVALPSNLAPGGSVTLNVTFTAPSTAGSLVLEAEMLKEHAFWFDNWASVKVSVAAAVWSASFGMSAVPATWSRAQSRSFAITVTNTGNTKWPSTGVNRVDLAIHFTTRTGGAATRSYWLTHQTYSVPADLAPGNSVTLTVTVTAPAAAGSMHLEAEMIKEGQFWFQQAASVPVTIS